MVTPDALRAMSENKRVTYVRGVIETAAQKIMSKNVDSAKSLDDNGMHSLDQVRAWTFTRQSNAIHLPSTAVGKRIFAMPALFLHASVQRELSRRNDWSRVRGSIAHGSSHVLLVARCAIAVV